ncbi:hypothetical protein ACFWPU_42630 [Streptomyces sp. NPDC058471]|uniref:hypothetical protein n=1 Tax=Streptomyces sp. NPDC058471 TaxID=3346516 RepID=UPI00365DD1A6
MTDESRRMSGRAVGRSRDGVELGLIGTGDSEVLLRPRDIYAGLASRPWPYLRHGQGEVLDKWFDRREQRIVVIKQNTGGGKKAVGLGHLTTGFPAVDQSG